MATPPDPPAPFPSAPRARALRTLWATALLGVLPGLACGGDDAAGPPTLERLEIVPGTVATEVGETHPLDAVAVYSDGTRSSVREHAVWTTDHETVAEVSVGSLPLLRARGPGSTLLRARLEAAEGTAVVEVAGDVPPDTTEPPPEPSGMGPLRVSSENPRYFATPAGRIVFLTGSHTWASLRDNGTADPPPVFDYDGYLDLLEQHGHNLIRLWAWEQDRWTQEVAGPYHFSPGPFQRTGPGTALDGLPGTDLTRFNEAYFERLRDRVERAGERGIYVAVMLFNGWSLGTKPTYENNNPWRGHPFNVSNNVNGIDGDRDGDGEGHELHTLGHAAALEIQEAYVRKVVETLADLDNVLWEISNESPGESLPWQEHMAGVVRTREAELGVSHPVGITVGFPGGDNEAVLASSADWVSLRGGVETPPVAEGTKVVISDTDHLCGVCGDLAWVWKSFTRGENPILMEGIGAGGDGFAIGRFDTGDPVWEVVRANMGVAAVVADSVELAETEPRPELSSTGFVLARTGTGDDAYVVFAPDGGTFDVDLRGTAGDLRVDWLDPVSVSASAGGEVTGGAVTSFSAPFGGGALLVLRPAGASTVFPQESG